MLESHPPSQRNLSQSQATNPVCRCDDHRDSFVHCESRLRKTDTRPERLKETTQPLWLQLEKASIELFVNGIGMTKLTPVTKYMVHLPLASMSRPPRNGLVICFGMGTSFRSMLSWGIPTTAVDLIPSVPAMFDYYHADAPKLTSSPLARIVIDDGRRFLDGANESYDVIVVIRPHPHKPQVPACFIRGNSTMSSRGICEKMGFYKCGIRRMKRMQLRQFP